MELKIRKIKLPMLIALLLLLFTALFSLIFALFGRGEEYESNANSTTINTADPADISEEHIEPITTIIQMTPADISRGSLILVNSD
ncbi:MAG: hypothetical protein FWC90_04775, partial [Oscillospiraceae bacterium]|nr:hypothetical protein [Oscillospiraceae bacterium]